MKPEQILHINYTSVNKFPPVETVEIYCRKLNKTLPFNKLECSECPYYRGSGQGTTVECEWGDEPPIVGKIRHINCGDATKELFRVSQLKDLKIITD
mgnify:CR=1 FL=1